MDNDERTRIGTRASTVAIVGNILLTIFNISIGFYSGSYALVSEGFHTISDIVTSIIAYIGFIYGSQPSDKEHPYGHGRAEALAGLVIVLFLFIIAYEIISGAIEKIFFGAAIRIPSPIALYVAIIGIFVNIFISSYIIKMGEKVHSSAIVADGKHQRVDVLSSIAILVGVICANSGFPQADPIVGLFIGIMIVNTAIGVFRENFNRIMGKMPYPEFLDDIKKVAESVPGVSNVHNVKADYFGAYATVSLHFELPGDMTLDESHKIVHLVQNKVLEEMDLVQEVTAHACPIGLEYDHSQGLDEE